MKFVKLLIAAIILACLSLTTVFAAVGPIKPEVAERLLLRENNLECRDPLKELQNKKEKIDSLLKEGKITKDEADKIKSRIDKKIKEINEFNKLPLEQKKEKLISRFKKKIEIKVSKGKLTRQQADELMRKFSEMIQKWDGTGYPGFGFKGHRMKGHPGTRSKTE